MTVSIICILCVVLLIVFISFRIVKHTKLSKEFATKVSFFYEQINTFFTEFFELTKNIVQTEQETIFISKWKELYSDIVKYPVSKRCEFFQEIAHYKETYKNLSKIISQSNEEINRKETVRNYNQKVNTFFTELFEITKNYVSYSMEIQFLEKWQELFSQFNTIDLRKEDDEYEEIERFKTVYSK